MQKINALLIFTLLLWIFTFNYAFWQLSFNEFGIEGLYIEGADKKECIKFSYLLEPKYLVDNNYSILSLNVSYEPKVKGKAYIEVYLNQNLLEKRMVNEIKEWYRVILPKELLKEENQIKICAYTSKSINKIEIKRDSFISRAKMADFSKENSFEKLLKDNVLYINEPAEVELVIRNYGSKEAIVEILPRKWEFKHAEIIEMPNELTFKVDAAKDNRPGIIRLKYKIMPIRIGKMALPKAILRYKDIFGDIKEISSTQPFIEVISGERIIGSINIEGIAEIGKTQSGVLKIKNIGQKEAKIISISLEAENADIEPNNFYITKLGKAQSKEFSFSLKPLNYGIISIKCKAVADKNRTFSCGSSEILIEKPKFDWKILLIGVTIIMIVGAYIYIIYR